MAGIGGARAAPQHVERAGVELGREVIDREVCAAGRGELDGERHPVESGADRRDGGPVVRSEREAVSDERCALHEQRDGLGSEGFDGVHLLAGHAKRLTARGQDTHIAATVADCLRRPGRLVDHMLAVVENEQGLARSEPGDRVCNGITHRNHCPDRHGDRRTNQALVGEGCEIDDYDAVSEGGCELVRDADR